MNARESKGFDEIRRARADREIGRLARFVLKYHLPEIRNGESAVDFAIRQIRTVKRIKKAI